MRLYPTGRAARERSLKTRTLMLMAIVITLLMAGATAFDIVHTQSALQQQLQTRARLLAGMQAETVAPALWDMDSGEVTTAIASLARDPAFQYAAVTDSDGKLVAEHGKAGATAAIVKELVPITHTERGKQSTIGNLMLHLSTAGLKQALWDSIWQGLVTLCVMLVALIGTSYAALRLITVPLGRMTEAMTRLAGGDTALEVPALDRHDEIGAIARAVDVFRSHMTKEAELAAEQAQVRDRAAAAQQAALSEMAATIERQTGEALAQIRDRTSTMTLTADEMSVSATRTGELASTATDAAAQALANAQMVASAAEQLAASIREIGGQASHSSEVVGQAVAAGNETRTTIETLQQQVERIGSVADMIGEIAAKTNLLALNATIEAARAGDAGKGFAVVASEVKQLATQTARSTQEISQHIDEVHAATSASVAAVMRIEQTITEINAIAGSIATAVEQQSAATAEISRNVAETATAANAMTERATDVAAEAGETGRRAASVRACAAGLNDAMEGLRHSVVRAVRTATPEVDRRAGERFATDLPCRVTIGGQTASARVADLGEGGACVVGGPTAAAGTAGTVAIGGVDFPLPFIVTSGDAGSLHLTFRLDKPIAARFAGIPAKLAARQAAA